MLAISKEARRLLEQVRNLEIEITRIKKHHLIEASSLKSQVSELREEMRNARTRIGMLKEDKTLLQVQVAELEKTKGRPRRINTFEHERSEATRNYEKGNLESDSSIFISYSDYITLLLTVFIILYSINAHDPSRIVESRRAIASSFIGKEVLLDKDKPLIVLADAQDMPVPEQFQQMRDEVAGELNELGLGDDIQVRTQKEGIIITLKDRITFEPGDASLIASSAPVLKKIAAVLKKNQEFTVEVEGHTDNMPINNRQFPSNWELSTARASNVVKFFIEQEGISPQRLSAKGMAEFRAVRGTDTSADRAQNRRVEINRLLAVSSG